MKILEEFDFNQRPSRSRYAPAVKALVIDNKTAVELTRGDDFPDDVKIGTVQAGVRTAIKKTGRSATTYIVSDDVIVVGLKPNGASSNRNGGGRGRSRLTSAPSPTSS